MEGDYALQEHFYSIALDTKLRILALRLIFLGTVRSTTVSAREVFLWALADKAARILVAHNHPSGDPQPSEEDKLFTRQLVMAGNVLDIEVVDHVIVGDSRENFYSFKKVGLL
jgi:DNA repair protein RadC